jgi:hypothetical protein
MTLLDLSMRTTPLVQILSKQAGRTHTLRRMECKHGDAEPVPPTLLKHGAGGFAVGDR